MASAPTVEPPDHELRITRLEEDTKTILSNQGKIIGALRHIATKDDLKPIETRLSSIKDIVTGLEDNMRQVLDHFGLMEKR